MTDPNTTALADKGDVRVRRRDGPPLILTREDRAGSTSRGAVKAARALRNLLAHIDAGTLADALLDEFPWTDYLPREDREQFAIDFARAFQASAELGDWSALNQLLLEWRDTALIHTDPELVRALSEPLPDDFGPVPPPTET